MDAFTGRERGFSPDWLGVYVSEVQPGLTFRDKRPPLVPVEPTGTKGSFSLGWYYEPRLKGARQHLRPPPLVSVGNTNRD
jgi:hypothetical protein